MYLSAIIIVGGIVLAYIYFTLNTKCRTDEDQWLRRIFITFKNSLIELICIFLHCQTEQQCGWIVMPQDEAEDMPEGYISGGETSADEKLQRKDFSFSLRTTIVVPYKRTIMQRKGIEEAK